MRVGPQRNPESPCQSKVCNLQIGLPVDEKILRLEISVDNTMRMAKY
jgi:hypothetical protein